MSRELTAADRRTPATPPANSAEETTPSIAALLDRVEQQLNGGHPRKAMELVLHNSDTSPWIKNALGVCQLRLQHPKAAVDLFRSLAVESGVFFRKSAPAIFKSNFATALLLSENLNGFLRAMDDLDDVEHPEFVRLRAAIARWYGEMGLWERLCWNVFGIVPRPLTLDFPPGAVK